jgi:hypothetical protein
MGLNTHLTLKHSDELEIKDTPESVIFTSFVDILLDIDFNGRLTTTKYYKSDNVNFAIVYFPFIRSTICNLIIFLGCEYLPVQ